MLEREGIIFRRQGAGTYAHKYALRIQTRAEHAYEFCDLLRLAGFEPSIQLISFDRHLPLPKEIASNLDIEPDTPALLVCKLFLANDQPAIYCLDFIPNPICCEDFEDDELKQPIFDFIKQRCGQSTVMNLAEIIPEATNKELAGLLDMKLGQPLLRIDEVGYNEEGQPILFTRAYYKDQFVRFSLLRKRI
jgi:GntR family transcriptional regulator